MPPKRIVHEGTNTIPSIPISITVEEIAEAVGDVGSTNIIVESTWILFSYMGLYPYEPTDAPYKDQAQEH